jgi:hypothetical protein
LGKKKEGKRSGSGIVWGEWGEERRRRRRR